VDIIVPRWEWRTFRQDFGKAEPRLTALAPDRVQHSAEVYVLVIDSDANVKYRDNLLDIKQLERVNDDGLEQWRPLLKERFPLAPALQEVDVSSVDFLCRHQTKVGENLLQPHR
jgi:exopolyphosphatase/guanosine-5'-triphosphate,3'-diphosphate pyrophosphatase